MSGDTFVLPVAGEQIILLIGNGATPEVFSHSASINTTRGFTGSAKFSSTDVADDTNPSAAAKTVRAIQSTDLSFDGAGTADGPSSLNMLQWSQGVNPQRNCKIVFNLSGANGGFTISVPLVCESFAITGAARDKATFTGKFSQADAPTSIAANA
ncbi:MAG TPA: hypothetical protein VGG29_03605 [Caulobacteraceae bacterium]|jgi:hypothetical protein